MTVEIASATTFDRSLQRPINIVSGVVCLVVLFLILGPRPEWVAGSMDVSLLPTVNATLNSITVALLVLGFAAVKTGRIEWHKRLMISAFGTSVLFLVSYVTYHWFSAGPALYKGGYRTLYLVILFSHIVLAAVILPMALNTLARGVAGVIPAHKRIAPTTFGLWLYVSVTGVLIYWMVHW